MCGGVFSRSQTHTFFFGQVILMHTRYGSEDLLTTMRRDGALQILPRGAHHDRPGRFPRAPPAHLASPHPRPRGTPCTCSSRAGARTGPLHPHSLQRLLLHLCSQMLGPAHSRQSLRMRWWSQMLSPPHSLHRLLTCWCWQRPRPPALPAHAPDASGRTDARAPALLAPLPLALLNALSFACMQMPGCSC